MAAPIITIGTPSATKISAISGHDQATVTFQSDVPLNNWEARATYQGQTIGHGSGLLVESGGSLAANTNATVYVENEELTEGDREYTITVFGHGSDGYWSDGTYEAVNLIDLTDVNIVDYIAYSSYSNGSVVYNTGTLNDPEDTPAIKVQELKDDWSYFRQLVFIERLGNASVNITKTSQYDRIRIAMHGGTVDGAILIDADSLMENGETYVLSFNIVQLTTNYSVVSNVSLVKAVI